MQEIEYLKRVFRDVKNLWISMTLFLMFGFMSVGKFYVLNNDVSRADLAFITNCKLTQKKIINGGVGQPKYYLFESKEYPNIEFRLQFPGLQAINRYHFRESRRFETNYTISVLKSELLNLSQDGNIEVVQLSDPKSALLDLASYNDSKNDDARSSWKVLAVISVVFLLWTINILYWKWEG